MKVRQLRKRKPRVQPVPYVFIGVRALWAKVARDEALRRGWGPGISYHIKVQP